MEEKHLNLKKVCGAILVFVMAFFIIVGSALITRNAKNNIKLSETNQKIAQENEKVIEKDKEIQKVEKENISEKENLSVEQGIKSEFLLPIHSKENILKGFLPQYNPNSVQQIKDIYGSDEKQVYLTFDDGPTQAITPQILDILKEEQVPATFFVLGSRVELNPDLVKRAFEEGHYIANHGYSHTYSQIYASTQSVIDEYNATEKAIQDAIGISEYHSYLFRFPGGSSGGKYHDIKAEAKQILANNGIASTNWNCLNGDAEAVGRTEQELLTRLYQSQEDNTSLIILMHDAYDKQATVNTLREVVQHYKAEGYVFKNFYEIF